LKRVELCLKCRPCRRSSSLLKPVFILLIGLLVGKEGPMIHSGGVIGAGIPQFESLTFTKLKLKMPYFRSDR